MSLKIASLIRWLYDKRKKDGTMRNLADSLAWKSFDELHKGFTPDPRNVRLGLVSDGFQPFANSQNSYSIWLVILIPYNLPPELCIR